MSACEILVYNNDYDKIGEWLENFVKSLPGRPVVIPTNDKLALMLARRYDRLKNIARIWTNSFDSLEGIISKNRIYVNAKKAGIPIPPTIISSKYNNVFSWTKKIQVLI